MSTPVYLEWTDQQLRQKIERLEHDKPLIVQWTQSDEDRLLAYREVEILRRTVIAMRNRIDDDTRSMNRMLEMRGFTPGSESAQ